MNELAQASQLLTFMMQFGQHSQVEIIIAVILPFFYWILEKIFEVAVSDRTSTMYIFFQTALPLYKSIQALITTGGLDAKGWTTYWGSFMSLVTLAMPNSAWRYIGIFVNTLMTYPDPRIPRQTFYSSAKMVLSFFPQLSQYVDKDFFKDDLSIFEKKQPHDFLGQFVTSTMNYLLPPTNFTARPPT